MVAVQKGNHEKQAVVDSTITFAPSRIAKAQHQEDTGVKKGHLHKFGVEHPHR